MRVRCRFARALSLAVALTAGAVTAEPVGWIDGGYWGGGQYNVVGWACDRYSSRSVMVRLIDPASGSTLVSTLANAPSEPAVGSACGAPGATNLRFSLPLAGWREEAVVGRTIQVRVVSNFYPYSVRSLANSGTMVYPDNRIIGVIDSAPWDGNQVVISGWACARGVAQSVTVHVYAGGPAGTGSWLTAGVANLWSESAV